MLAANVSIYKVDQFYRAEYHNKSTIIEAMGNGQFEAARNLQKMYDLYRFAKAGACVRSQASKGG